MPTMKMKDDNNNNVVKEELAEGGNVEASVEGEAKQKMKKGPWTAAEDAMLIEYVNKYGEGNWNSVQKNSGLSRCGKSCRLRWANHLRPNLKKGAFSQDEEQIIIDLHAKLGNKWARMASQLPGRTDNEIKNFWNTRMKRRQRAGLPLYPPQVQDEALVFHAHQQYSAPPPPPPEPQPQPQSFSFSSLLSSSDYHDDHHTLNNYDTTHHHQLYHQNMGMGMYSVSPYGLNNIYGFDSSGVKAGMVLKSSREMRLCSTPSQTPTSSYSISTSGLHGFMGINANHYEVASSSPEPNTSSGLLDDLVVEAQALSRTKTQAAAAAGRKRKKSMAEEEHTTPTQTQRDDIDLSSSQSSTGKKAIGDEKDPLEEMNSMDDDLFSLLNNFPSQMPMPEWYRKGQNQSQNQQEDASGAHTTTDQELAWTLGTCWNNMPSIC